MKFDYFLRALVILVFASVLALLGTWLTQVVWAWVVPDIFAGMVSQGLLPATLTLYQAFKLGLLTLVLGLRPTSSK